MSNLKTPVFFLSVLTQSMFPHPASPFEANLLVLLVACYSETAAFIELLWTESFLHVIDSSYGQRVINVCELSHSSEMVKSPFKWSPSLRLCIMDILSLALNLKHQLLWVSLHPWPDFLTDLWHCFGNLLHNHRVASQGFFLINAFWPNILLLSWCTTCLTLTSGEIYIQLLLLSAIQAISAMNPICDSQIIPSLW